MSVGRCVTTAAEGGGVGVGRTGAGVGLGGSKLLGVNVGTTGVLVGEGVEVGAAEFEARAVGDGEFVAIDDCELGVRVSSALD